MSSDNIMCINEIKHNINLTDWRAIFNVFVFFLMHESYDKGSCSMGYYYKSIEENVENNFCVIYRYYVHKKDKKMIKLW
jgi:hypothetical protein